MKSIASVLSIIALGFGLLGCPGSGGGGGGTGTASGTFTRVALVPNETDDTVSVFLVDAVTGQLRPRGYVISGSSPRAVAVHPSGQFFYTINNVSNNVSANALSATGLVTAVAGSPFPLSPATGPTAVAVSSNGLFLFVANQGSNNVSVLSINQTTGALTKIFAPFSLSPAAGPTAIAVHPSGNLLFVTNNTNNPSLPGTLSVFTIQSTGFLTQIGSPVQLLRNPQSLALNESGTVVYVANKGDDSISAFLVNQTTGALSPIANQPFLTSPGTAPSSIAVGPGDRFLYVANSGGTGNIGLFPINQVTGALSQPSTIRPMIPTGAHPQFIRIDPDGSTLYATDSTSNLVSFFSIDPVTGLLTPAGTRAMRAGPGAVAFASGTAPVTPTPTFAYVANDLGNNVSAFAITPATGVLTELVGVGSPFPVAPGTGPVALSADPLGQFVYVGNSGTDDLSAFMINGTTGSLSGITGSPFPLPSSANPQSVTTDPLGQHAYVTNQGSNNVSAFSIASGTGILTAIGAPVPTGAGTGPRAVTVEASGRFAYVVYATTNQVSMFPIDQTNGALMGTGVLFPLAANAAPQAIVADPTGRFLYVANTGTSTVSAYLINAATGLLTPIPSTPFSVGVNAGPLSLGTDVFGQFLYVANGSTNNVSGFVIDQTTGVLLSSVPGSPFAAGLNPSAITTIGRF